MCLREVIEYILMLYIDTDIIIQYQGTNYWENHTLLYYDYRRDNNGAIECHIINDTYSVSSDVHCTASIVV